jgi:hypothetical protein
LSTILRYIGNPGQFIVGVPARDMLEDEAGQHGGVEALLASRLYIKDNAPGEPIVPIEEATLTGVINLADGVDDSEAELAGRALQKRRRKHGTD